LVSTLLPSHDDDHFKEGVLGALEPQKFFSGEPGAQSLTLLGAKTKIMILAKWNLRVQPWSPRAPIALSWGCGALQFVARSPGALNPFGTLINITIFPTKT